MFKQKLLLPLLLFGLQHIHAVESLFPKSLLGKMVDAVGKSEPMSLYSQYVQKEIDIQVASRLASLNDEPASSEYQQLGKEAQDALGIPVDRQRSVKKIPSISFLHRIVAAVANADAIYVNEDMCNERTYGARRFAFFHEATHIKYNDSSIDTLAESATMLLSALLTHKAIKFIKPQGRYKILHGLGVLVTSLAAGSSLSNRFHHYMEYRADVEGLCALQCYSCAQEAAAQRRESFEVQNNLLIGRYLSADQVESIADDLKQQNKVCEFHNT